MKIDIVGGELTKHFDIKEFYCNTDAEMYIDFLFFEFVNLLEEFRVWYNRPINITSGYRSFRLNRACGGTSDSLHRKARAVDFLYPQAYFSWSSGRKEQFLQNVKTKWTAICHKHGYFAQCNFYVNRFHLGMSTYKDNYWDLRKRGY